MNRKPNNGRDAHGRNLVETANPIRNFYEPQSFSNGARGFDGGKLSIRQYGGEHRGMMDVYGNSYFSIEIPSGKLIQMSPREISKADPE